MYSDRNSPSRFEEKSKIHWSKIIINIWPARFLGSGIKCDTSEPHSHKVGNKLFNSFTTAFRNLCKHFPIHFFESSAPLHSLCICLIWSRIFNISSLALMSGCIWMPYQIPPWVFLIKDPSSESSFVDNSSIEDKIDSFSSVLHSIYTKPTSSNCEKVIMLIVRLWDEVAYGSCLSYNKCTE